MKLALHPRTDPAALQEELPVRPQKAHRASLSTEAIARDIAGLESVEHPVRGEADLLGDLARGEEAIVRHDRLTMSMRSISASHDAINSPG
jgi:hypothetical protein